VAGAAPNRLVAFNPGNGTVGCSMVSDWQARIPYAVRLALVGLSGHGNSESMGSV